MAPALDDVGRHEGLFLKIAAITMMHEEHAMLAKWHDLYGRLVGPENPYVVSHGVTTAIAKSRPRPATSRCRATS